MRFSFKAGLAAAQIAATTCAIFFGAEAASAQPADAPVPVVETTVGQGDVNIVLDGLGTVRALNEATIRSQVTGVLQSVDFAEGATVHRGDVLAQIDPRPYQAALEQAEAQKQRDEASLADTQTNLDRNTPLLSRGFATDQLVTNEKYQIAELQASVKADQATIDNAQTQLSYTTLTAPFDGVVGLRLLDVGNVIHPNDTTGLVVVSQIQPVSVVFTLPATELPQVQAAQQSGKVTVIARDQSGTSVLDTGELLATSNAANPQTGTIQFKAVFPNAQRRLWPGTFVDTEVVVSVRHDGLTVPNDALQQGPDGPFVYVVDPSGKAHVARVRVDQRAHGGALIGEGLHAGEVVVTQGQSRLTEGTQVVAASPAQVPNTSTASAGMLP